MPEGFRRFSFRPRLSAACARPGGRVIALYAVLVCVVPCIAPAAVGQGKPPRASARAPRTPSETVRGFYSALRASRFRDALMMSVYRPAIERLNKRQLAELRSEFEALAATVPAQVEIAGEQTSKEESTVFIKQERAGKSEVLPIALVMYESRWIVGDRETAAAVAKLGSRYFFELRVATHHAEAEAMMTRIARAQLVYSLAHDGVHAEVSTLVSAGLLPEDVAGANSNGYRYRVALAPDRKQFVARAEPVSYGRTGRLSFYMDARGVRRGDAGGKPLMLSDGTN